MYLNNHFSNLIHKTHQALSKTNNFNDWQITRLLRKLIFNFKVLYVGMLINMLRKVSAWIKMLVCLQRTVRVVQRIYVGSTGNRKVITELQKHICYRWCVVCALKKLKCRINVLFLAENFESLFTIVWIFSQRIFMQKICKCFLLKKYWNFIGSFENIRESIYIIKGFGNHSKILLIRFIYYWKYFYNC